MANALMKNETIDSKQIDDIMEGKEPRPPEGWSDSGDRGSAPPKETQDDNQPEDEIVDPAGSH